MLHLSAAPSFIESHKPCRKCGSHRRYKSSRGVCVDCAKRRNYELRRGIKQRKDKIDYLTPSGLIERWKDRVKKALPTPNALPWATLDKIMARR